MALDNEPFKNEWTPEMAKEIDRYWSESTMEMIIHVIESTGVMQHMVPDETVLEVGCGTGKIWEILKQARMGKYIGVDYSKAMLDVFRGKAPHLDLIQGNATALPFPDYQFDLVCCIEVLRHITQWEEAIKELYRVARRRVIFTIEVSEGPTEFKGENRNAGYINSEKKYVHYQVVHNAQDVLNFLSANFSCRVDVRPIDNKKWMFVLHKDSYELTWHLIPIDGIQQALTMYANTLADLGQLLKATSGKPAPWSVHTKMHSLHPLVLEFISKIGEQKARANGKTV